MTRNKVLSQAIDQCMREIYSYAQPFISWDDFMEENKIFIKKEKEYYNLPKENRPSYKEYMGLKPYEFYYLPQEIMKSICNSYIYAYKLDDKQELLDTIKILKDYCKKPIVDKYIEGELREDGTRWPGHRGYDHPDNLEKEIVKILGDIAVDNEYYQQAILDKFFEFLDMAGDFYNWTRDLNTFNINVYLGASPNSNKEAVIENWKKYRNKDIEINEEQIKKEYYGEEYD